MDVRKKIEFLKSQLQKSFDVGMDKVISIKLNIY